MNRYMYDAISANAGALVPLNPDVVAIYLTGSPDIRWTSTQVAFFPRVKTFVRIDQGGPTSPQFAATVADVEKGAWSVQQAESVFLKKSTAARPTIYCDRTDFADVTANCPIWLAAPGLSDAQAIALAKTDKRIVAVQNVWSTNFDRSILIDPTWPNKAPIPPSVTQFECQVERWQAGFGWVLDTTTKTLPGTKYRARVNDGHTWSSWRDFWP